MPEGPSTQDLKFLVPKTILLMVFGTRDLINTGYLDPLGIVRDSRAPCYVKRHAEYLMSEVCIDRTHVLQACRK